MSNWNSVWTNGAAAAYWTADQKANNVDIIYKYFNRRGWKIKPIAAMLGNMEYESYLNPQQWEQGESIYSGGFGLVQWTPYTKFSSWAGAGWESNGDLQLDRIQYEMENELQWIPTSTYDFTFYQFTRKTAESIEYLTKAFEYCYERGTWNDVRVERAEYWYKYLKRKQLMFYIMFAQDEENKKGVFLK